MTTKITLDDPTESGQWIADLGVQVEHGGSIDIEDDALAEALLRNPIWKKAGKPAKAEAKTAEGEGA